MGTVAKVGMVGLVVLMVAVVFVPGIRSFFSRLFTSSETISLPATNASSPGEESDEGRQLELITLLGFDAIPAILNPDFVTADEAERWMEPDEQVLGLSINGDNRAYSIPMLSRHEIVNDVVGGVPVAVTW
ncbi:MAG: DUF3179 domain-containing protein [Chloroflexi bacterium]|nr:DUF3179 domain-containing protein [Chloroflexota bacterium]